MIRKQLFRVFIVLLFVFFMWGEQASAASLSDIPEKYANEINYLIEEEIINGYPDGTFKPKKQVTRAEAAVMIGKALDLDGEERNTSFTDVASTSFASGFIESAYEKNIIGGVGNGKYEPSRSITRGEMAILMSRAFNLSDTSGVFYMDVATHDTYYIAINKVSTAGIAMGLPDGTFNPKQSITRQDFSLMVARATNSSFKVENKIETKTKYVTANALHVRKGPGTTYESRGLLPENAKVTTHNEVKGWVYITSDTLSGYVSQKYLADKPIVKPEPTPEPEDTETEVDTETGTDSEEEPGAEQPSTPDKKPAITIAIDAGHGDHDPGASANGIIEKEINLEVAKYVKEDLEEAGFKVFLTRSDDSFLELNERVNVAVAAGADIFVSIHANAASPSANGTETYYYTSGTTDRVSASKSLAGDIQKNLVQSIGTNDRGVKTAGFVVIKNNPLPAVLVELGFLTSTKDAQILATSKQLAAQGISKGIIDYYNR